MRYIGNKSKLLPFLGRVIDELGVRPGLALDPFAGTASVAQYLKRRGFAVLSGDLMTYSHVLQRAYVQLDVLPDLGRVLAEDAELRSIGARADFQARLASRLEDRDAPAGCEASAMLDLVRVLLYLEAFLPEATSFITREYSGEPASVQTGRMFFTPANARRIDAVRTRIEEWRRSGWLCDDGFHLLLATLLEASDSVANTTGVYAAYVKSWQPNALRPLRLRVPPLVLGTGLACRAHLADANRLVRQLPAVDLFYLDPPYNTRQYSAYYHIPEVIARGWFDEEPTPQGKTGLIPAQQTRSRWSNRRACAGALHDLVAHLRADHVLLSYNSEGIISRESIEKVFGEFGRPGSLRIHEHDYARYRSDSDHDSRVYKADRVTEYVFSCRLRTAVRT